MYLMYVDESGDCGLPEEGSPSDFFCLSGVVLHELRWRETIRQLVQFRHWLKARYRIYLDDELHAAEMINKPSKLAPSLRALPKHQRLAVLRHFADEIACLSDVSIINVVVDKTSGRVPNKDEVFRWAWCALFQRFENTIQYKNFPGPRNAQERGIIFPDATDGLRLKQFLERMRVANPLRVRHSSGGYVIQDVPVRAIIEDPVVRQSQYSYLIQLADCAVFLLKQHIQPSEYMRRHGGHSYFRRLEPVLCKHASRSDALGVVRL
jgi:hypothetical protein